MRSDRCPKQGMCPRATTPQPLSARRWGLVSCRVPSTSDRDDRVPSAAPNEAVDVLLRFGASMLRAGNTATLTHEWIEVIARQMDFDRGWISLSFDSITASVRRTGGWVTAMREIYGAGHLCVRDDRIVQSRADTRCPSGIRFMRLRYWRVGDGTGNSPRFQPTIVR